MQIYPLTLQHVSISLSQTTRASSRERTEFWYVVSVRKNCDNFGEKKRMRRKGSRGTRGRVKKANSKERKEERRRGEKESNDEEMNSLQ